MPIPRLQYHLGSRSSSLYGWITVAGEKVHRVGDFDAFYRALGYSDEARHTGLLPDEFLWERYTRDGAVKSAQCLQVQVVAYLHKHSVKFNTEYGQAYDEMKGRCVADHLDNTDDRCVDCPMHPRFAY